MNDLLKRIAQLPPEKRAQFEKMMREKARQAAADSESGSAKQAGPSGAQAELTLFPRAERPVLSFAQQRLWFVDRLAREKSAAYNISAAMEMVGPLDEAALRHSLAAVIARHEVLRTNFQANDGVPFQLIHAAIDLPLEVRNLEPDELQLALDQSVNHLFDLARGPLLVFHLFRLGPDRHVLVMILHHIISDAQSLSLMMGEFAAYYRSQREGRPLQLPALALQYADFAASQVQGLGGEGLQRLRDFWQTRLQGVPTRHDLPKHHGFRDLGLGQTADVWFKVEAQVTQQIKELCRQEGATLFMLLHAALALCLARSGNHWDSVIGTSVNNRTDLRLENLVGLFVNTVVLRLTIQPDADFKTLLNQAVQADIDAFNHAAFPFEQVVELHRQDSGRNALVQIMLMLQIPQTGGLSLPDLELRQIPLNQDKGRFDLALSFLEQDQQLTGLLTYDSQMFEAGFMQALCTRLSNLLAAIGAGSGQAVADIPLMETAEQQRLLALGSGPTPDWVFVPVHEQIRAQAARAGSALAVLDGAGQRLSYDQLEQRANQLAVELREQGIGFGSLVAIALDRGCDYVVAILGILKVGAAYLPLNPDDPEHRRTYMLNDARVDLYLCEMEQALEYSPFLINPYYDESAAAVTAFACPPEAAAFAIYTSGSTGQPKASVTTHGAIANTVAAATGGFRFEPGDQVLHLHNFVFDAASMVIFKALCQGACLHIAPLEQIHDPAKLGAYVSRERIDGFSCTPSMLAGWDVAAFASVSRISCGGEALAPELAETWRSCGLINQYGPSEAAVIATSAPLNSVLTSTIGRAIEHASVLVLDPRGLLAPQGVPGELSIGGRGLSSGYLHRPGLTAERFVPHPLGSGERLYRSGDSARVLADGNLVFLGRLDHQVKLRGFRIELGEIENALLDLVHVAEAAAVISSFHETPQLVAYLVPEAGARLLGPGEMVQALKQRLPHFMVPGLFVQLDQLPLNNTHKVDRLSLSSALPGDALVLEHVHQQGPATPTEEKLAALWQALVPVTNLGSDAHFFELGGHSLLAVRLVAQIEAQFGIGLTVADVFDYPTLAAQARLIDSGTVREAEVIPVQPRELAADGRVYLPASFAQKRMFFLHAFSEASSAYHIPGHVRLDGPLDVAVLEQALSLVINRHEALRTRFVERQGDIQQVIEPSADFSLNVIELDETNPAAIAELASQTSERAFDLEHDLLARISCVRLSCKSHLLLVNQHHIITDGWSSQRMLAEISVSYNALLQDRTPELEPLRLHYGDYAVWQKQLLEGPTLQTDLDFWRAALADAPALLSLPTQRSRAGLLSTRAARLGFGLDAELSARIDAFVAVHGATAYMFFQAMLAVLLGRHAQQETVVLGCPVANRTHADLEPVLGFFVNTLAMATSFGDDPSLEQLLVRVRAQSLKAYAHQQLPFDKLVEALGLPKNIDHSPLFQVLLVLQNLEQSEAVLSGLAVAPLGEGQVANAKFDLSFLLTRTPAGYLGKVEYNAELFQVAYIQTLLDRLLCLIDNGLTQPHVGLSRIGFIDEASRNTLLEQWGPRQEIRGEQTLHQLVEAWAARTPQAIALLHPDETALTYAELNDRANGLAQQLLAHGVQAEELVGLYAPRDNALVVGLLAILKAGAAYLPMDLAYPAQRVGFMLEDAQARLVLCDPERAALLPASVTALGLEAAPIAANPNRPVSPQQLAYAIYTSGSTGQPKGVLISHGHVARLFLATAAPMAFSNGDCWSFFHSHAFDFSVWEIWGALCHGARLLVVPHLASRDPRQFAQLLAEYGVTVLNQTPSAFRQLVNLEQEDQNPLPGLCLRLVIFGGEALDPGIVALWYRFHGPVPSLVNMYGITETCVHVTHQVLEPFHGSLPETPLGEPLSHMGVLVLDKHLHLLEPDLPGEMWIAGDACARGYLNRPALTAERFVPDPFSARPGARLYRSGDRGRLQADGSLHYLGRLDNQVQLRGFRIETGEVAAACSAFTAVKDAVVMARGETLAAWLLADEALNLANLRDFLQRSLPHYMLPAHFLVLADWPLTANGKLDRKTLLAMDLPATPTRPDQHLEGSAALLASLWSGLLEVDQIGLDDDFFKLGGHSLLATQLATRIRESFAVNLNLRTLFEASSLKAQTEAIAAAKHQNRPSRPPLRPVPRDQELPLSFAQTRIWFLQRLEGFSASYNIPAALRLRGRLRTDLLQQCFEQIFSRHESLRTGFGERDGQPVLTILRPFTLALEAETLPGTRLEDRELAMQATLAAEVNKPFDLAQPPLLRCRLLRLDPEDHVLVLVAHHIIADGWSVSVLVRELTALYASLVAGQPSPLPPLPVQVADVTYWQRQWLQGEVLAEQVGFWTETLAELPVLALPYDFPRPARPNHSGAALPFHIDRDLSRYLLRFSQTQGASLFMTLMAGFQWVLASYAGQDDFAVGTPIANRNEQELEPLIGLFMNALVIRARVSAKQSFAELLASVRTTCLDAYAHQDVPFEQIAEALQPERNLSLPLWYQVMLILQNTPNADLALADLELEPLPTTITQAKLDLTLYLHEGPDGIAGSLEYSTELFETATVTRLLAHFSQLLRQALAEPEIPLGRLSFSDEAERRALLAASTYSVTFPAVALVHQRFEAQVRRDPSATAVTDPMGTRYDYATLNRLANLLATRLRGQGLTAEERVGIYTGSGPQMVVAVLAVLKAGGAFVPMDSAYPRERLRQMFDDSGARFLLCQAGLEQQLPCQPSACLVLDERAAQGPDPGNPEPICTSTSLAYLIYSSGSTGKPKGIALPHQAWGNAYDAWALDYELVPGDRHLQMASFSFDVCAGDLARSLCSGANLVLCPREVLLQPDRLYELLSGQRISVAEFVPAVVRVLLEYLEQNELSLDFMRLLLVGSDLWNMGEFAKLERFLGETTRLVNSYGVTEAAIDSSFFSRACQAPVKERPVPIGRPFANTQLLVLDGQLGLSPQGVPGILYLGGPNLARGYFADPARTALKFVPHPLSQAPGERLYRTDDKVRYLSQPDGSLGPLEFLGRADHQVKLRGLRIELGEVEAALEALAAVARAVVVIQGSGNAALLVAYLVPQSSAQPPDPFVVRESLRSHLPDYMIPAAILILETLPLTPNGKIDRKHLPEPDRQALLQDSVAPRTPLERQIATIWCEVLNLEEVGVTHNFFDLGGHSLLATRVSSRLSRELDQEVALRLMFEEPTIAALAERLELMAWASEGENGDFSQLTLLEEEGSL